MSIPARLRKAQFEIDTGIPWDEYHGTEPDASAVGRIPVTVTDDEPDCHPVTVMQR
ncbi:MAG: hypothetical protein VKM34_02890 [Cyanobacteriota bacterium]|nr:hypothetical protein [Cyanobacteriota bacterium]